MPFGSRRRQDPRDFIPNAYGYAYAPAVVVGPPVVIGYAAPVAYYTGWAGFHVGWAGYMDWMQHEIYDLWSIWQQEIATLHLSRAEQRARLMQIAQREEIMLSMDNLDRLLQTTEQIGADRYGRVSEFRSSSSVMGGQSSRPPLQLEGPREPSYSQMSHEYSQRGRSPPEPSYPPNEYSQSPPSLHQLGSRPNSLMGAQSPPPMQPGPAPWEISYPQSPPPMQQGYGQQYSHSEQTSSPQQAQYGQNSFSMIQGRDLQGPMAMPHMADESNHQLMMSRNSMQPGMHAVTTTTTTTTTSSSQYGSMIQQGGQQSMGVAGQHMSSMVKQYGQQSLPVAQQYQQQALPGPPAQAQLTYQPQAGLEDQMRMMNVREGSSKHESKPSKKDKSKSKSKSSKKDREAELEYVPASSYPMQQLQDPGMLPPPQMDMVPVEKKSKSKSKKKSIF